MTGTTPWKNPLWAVCVNFLTPAKLINNCRSHAKGDSQKFKIEEMRNWEKSG